MAAAASCENQLSLVRLDPLQHVFELRAYGIPIDPSAPLKKMRLPYIVTGIVTISGGTATVSMVSGTITRDGLRDFDHKLRSMGVEEVVWERHRSDGSIKYVKRVLQCSDASRC